MVRTNPCLQCSALAGQVPSQVPVWRLETKERLRGKTGREETFARQLGGLGPNFSNLKPQRNFGLQYKTIGCATYPTIGLFNAMC